MAKLSADGAFYRSAPQNTENRKKRKEQKMTKSEALFQRAVQVMPGGVNSPYAPLVLSVQSPNLSKAQKAHTFTTRMGTSI